MLCLAYFFLDDLVYVWLFSCFGVLEVSSWIYNSRAVFEVWCVLECCVDDAVFTACFVLDAVEESSRVYAPEFLSVSSNAFFDLS